MLSPRRGLSFCQLLTHGLRRGLTSSGAPRLELACADALNAYYGRCMVTCGRPRKVTETKKCFFHDSAMCRAPHHGALPSGAAKRDESKAQESKVTHELRETYGEPRMLSGLSNGQGALESGGKPRALHTLRETRRALVVMARCARCAHSSFGGLTQCVGSNEPSLRP